LGPSLPKSMTNESNNENNEIESKMDEDGNEMENETNDHISFSSTSEFTSRLDLKLQVMIFRENKV